MNELRNAGGYLEIDQNGFILKKASLELIQEKWKQPIEETVKAYQEHFAERLIAVYIRGSVAVGKAIDGISDLDTIAIVDLPEAEAKAGWGEEFSQDLVKKYPFVEKVEILVVTMRQARDLSRAVRIMLKTQSVCVLGEDVSNAIPPIKIGREAAQHMQALQSELTEAINYFEYNWGTSQDEKKKRCSWIMKRILRTGFELVMEREQKYTRDLYPCFESFSKYYPNERERMYQTLELALNSTADRGTVIPILRTWLEFMPVEIKSIFNFGEGL